MMKGKRIAKRVCAWLLCAVLIVSLIPVGFADSDKKEDYTIAEPTLVSLEKQGEGLKLTWNAVDGISRYSVHRKLDYGTWYTIANVDDTSYLDTDLGGATEYTYTVRCVDSGNNYLSWYDETGLSYSMPWSCATPVVSGTASNNAIVISWNAVSGAAKYSVHRKVNDGTWWTIATVNGTSYTDTDITAGTKYTYTVRCVGANDKYCSDYDPVGVSFTPAESDWLFSAPVLQSAVFTGNAVKVTWGAVAGANAYSVHRKVNGGEWTTIAESVKETSYTDYNVNSGNTYTYTVRVRGTGSQYYASWYDETGITPDMSTTTWTLGVPELQSATNSNGNVFLVWTAVPGATRYSIHRKTAGGTWWTIGYSDTNTYTDNTVKSGTQYVYTVRCVDAAGNYLSDFDPTGVKIDYFLCDAPVFKVTVTNGAGIQITWNPVNGASHYSVHRKTNGGTWWTIADSVSGTSYTDTTLVPGTTYTYTVRCRGTGDQPYYTSWYRDGDPAYTVIYYGGTYVSGLENSSGVEDTTFNGITFETKAGYIRIKWPEIPLVSGYRVLRKANDGTIWKNITTVPAGTTVYDDYSVVSNTSYTYTIRGVNASGSFVGDYDTVGKTIRYYDAPEIIDVTRETGGLMITWNPIIGINNYQVYRQVKDDAVGVSGSWKLLGSTQDLYYVDKNVEKGVEYYYGVRCVNNEGNAVVSGMMTTTVPASWEIPTGGSFAYRVDWLNTPILASVELDGNAALFKWKPVEGAAKYQVIRRTANTSWQKLAIVNDTAKDKVDFVSYVDNKRASGTVYWYSVYCLDSSNKQMSNFDPDGVVLRYYEMAPILNIENIYEGVSLKWEVVDFTSAYRIYRKVGNNVWEKIGTSTTTSYVDTTAVNGITYCYAISSTDSTDTQLNDFYTGGFATSWNNKITFYSAPVMKSVVNTNGGVEVKWGDVDRIKQYLVFRKVSGGDWVRITPAAVTGLSYVDFSAESGKTYTYTVRCCDTSGAVVSGFDATGLTVNYYATPQLKYAVAANDGITIQWTASGGADGYNVYRRLPGGIWTFLKWVPATKYATLETYKDNSGLVPGQTYEYTVRAKKGDVMSWYVDTGVSAVAK